MGIWLIYVIRTWKEVCRILVGDRMRYVQSTVYNVQCTVCIVQCIVFDVYCTSYTVHRTLCDIQTLFAGKELWHKDLLIHNLQQLLSWKYPWNTIPPSLEINFINPWFIFNYRSVNKSLVQQIVYYSIISIW